jgi:hypothetical protein
LTRALKEAEKVALAEDTNEKTFLLTSAALVLAYSDVRLPWELSKVRLSTSNDSLLQNATRRPRNAAGRR